MNEEEYFEKIQGHVPIASDERKVGCTCGWPYVNGGLKEYYTGSYNLHILGILNAEDTA